jgi:hypothetical protein
MDFKDIHKVRVYFGFTFEEILEMPYWVFMIYFNGLPE